MMRIIMANNILKWFFGIKLCWYLIIKKSVSKSPKFGQKSKIAISLFYAYFVSHFCYHSNGKI